MSAETGHLRWSLITHLVSKYALGDVLIVMDCCAAADAVRSPRKVALRVEVALTGKMQEDADNGDADDEMDVD